MLMFYFLKDNEVIRNYYFSILYKYLHLCNFYTIMRKANIQGFQNRKIIRNSNLFSIHILESIIFYNLLFHKQYSYYFIMNKVYIKDHIFNKFKYHYQNNIHFCKNNMVIT
mmetsp:Transcript_8991/g.789  ORF Transcript_8991/g.789 Transcript_8991/m.789 type:complete len:111 (-) Transcript_8991:234-566(-)